MYFHTRYTKDYKKITVATHFDQIGETWVEEMNEQEKAMYDQLQLQNKKRRFKKHKSYRKRLLQKI